MCWVITLIKQRKSQKTLLFELGHQQEQTEVRQHLVPPVGWGCQASSQEEAPVSFRPS